MVWGKKEQDNKDEYGRKQWYRIEAYGPGGKRYRERVCGSMPLIKEKCANLEAVGYHAVVWINVATRTRGTSKSG